jgi:hypothetical protein
VVIGGKIIYDFVEPGKKLGGTTQVIKIIDISKMNLVFMDPPVCGVTFRTYHSEYFHENKLPDF